MPTHPVLPHPVPEFPQSPGTPADLPHAQLAATVTFGTTAAAFGTTVDPKSTKPRLAAITAGLAGGGGCGTEDAAALPIAAFATVLAILAVLTVIPAAVIPEHQNGRPFQVEEPLGQGRQPPVHQRAVRLPPSLPLEGSGEVRAALAWRSRSVAGNARRKGEIAGGRWRCRPGC